MARNLASIYAFGNEIPERWHAQAPLREQLAEGFGRRARARADPVAGSAAATIRPRSLDQRASAWSQRTAASRDALPPYPRGGVRYGQYSTGGEIMQRFRSVALRALSLGVASYAGGVAAHHSIQAQFDVHKTITISGVIAKVEYINPHSYLTVDVTEPDGSTTRWAFEMAAAGQLRRAGLSRADRGGLKAGDELTVTAMPARNGSTTGLAQILTLTDGREFNFTPDPTSP